MNVQRKYVLGGAFVGLLLLSAYLLADVLATVFFAITVAYVLMPVRNVLVERNVSPWWASVAATVAAFVGVLLVFSPLVVVLFLRFDSVLALVAIIPDQLEVSFLGYTSVVTLAQTQAIGVSYLRSLVASASVVVPVLVIKLTLFGFVVFSLLQYAEAVRGAAIAVVPPSYHGVATALERRARETLYAIYVLQVATAVGTFVTASAVFYGLGYSNPFALATIAALLQFLPIVGPSVLLALLGVYELVIGDVIMAVAVVLLGGFFVAWLPDVLIRPRLAEQTAGLAGSLYFIGFVGGLLTIGAVGIIAGPLVVALVVEASILLSAELRRDHVDADE
ncbi:MAG: AI-2E family transporter [Halobacteriota archaeon]